MKHVLVLDTGSLARDFIRAMRLRNPNGLGLNYDSADIFHDEKSVGHMVREALQSEDGIQFHHFRQRVPHHQGLHTPNERTDLEPWINRLEVDLKAVGETLDAVVIPPGEHADSALLLDWVRSLKAQFPGIKIMVQDPPLHAQQPGQSARRFAVPRNEDASITTARRQAIITRSNRDYELADGIDLATKNYRGDDLANALRDLLGMQHLPEERRAGFGGRR